MGIKVLKVAQNRAWVLEARVEIDSKVYEFQVFPKDQNLNRNVFYFSADAPSDPNTLPRELLLRVADEIDSAWDR